MEQVSLAVTKTSFEIMQFVLHHGAHTSASHIDILPDDAVLESPASVEHNISTIMFMMRDSWGPIPCPRASRVPVLCPRALWDLISLSQGSLRPNHMSPGGLQQNLLASGALQPNLLASGSLRSNRLSPSSLGPSQLPRAP